MVLGVALDVFAARGCRARDNAISACELRKPTFGWLTKNAWGLPHLRPWVGGSAPTSATLRCVFGIGARNLGFNLACTSGVVSRFFGSGAREQLAKRGGSPSFVERLGPALARASLPQASSQWLLMGAVAGVSLPLRCCRSAAKPSGQPSAPRVSAAHRSSSCCAWLQRPSSSYASAPNRQLGAASLGQKRDPC